MKVLILSLFLIASSQSCSLFDKAEPIEPIESRSSHNLIGTWQHDTKNCVFSEFRFGDRLERLHRETGVIDTVDYFITYNPEINCSHIVITIDGWSNIFIRLWDYDYIYDEREELIFDIVTSERGEYGQPLFQELLYKQF